MRFVIFVLLLGASSAFGLTLASPDERTWEQVTADFSTSEVQHANDGDRDGRRLKELDPERAVAFLLPFLSKDRPRGLRLKAIGALGWSSFEEAIPALSAIALDSTDDEEVRSEALNPGLCHMQSPEPVRTATTLADDKSLSVRTSAYGVFAHYGTEAAVSVLEQRLRANDRPGMRALIFALLATKHPRAAKIVFDNVSADELAADEGVRDGYSATMERYRLRDARENMAEIARARGGLSRFNALRYFASFPSEEIVPSLINYVETGSYGRNLYETIIAFTKSPWISDASKRKLSALITAGKVITPQP